MFFLGSNSPRVGRGVFKEEEVVIVRIEQRSLEVVRLREGNPPEMAPAKHLALALQVHSRQEFGYSLEVVDGSYRFTNAVIERQAKYEPTSDPQ